MKNSARRLAIVYSIAWFCILAGPLLAYAYVVDSFWTMEAHERLDQDWSTMKGYLRVTRDRPIWFYDRDDADERVIVGRLREFDLIRASDGRTVESSDLMAKLQSLHPSTFEVAYENARQTRQPAWVNVYDAHGRPYLIKCGMVAADESQSQYFAVIGRLVQGPPILRLMRSRVLIVAVALIAAFTLTFSWFTGSEDCPDPSLA